MKKQTIEEHEMPLLSRIISVIFFMIGGWLYTFIGLPIAGIICGWIDERDRVMGTDTKEEPFKSSDEKANHRRTN